MTTGIKKSDARHAVARRAQTLPVAGDVVTDRCDRAETGDDDALETLHHGVAQACLS